MMKRLLAFFFTLPFVGMAQENNYSLQFSGFTNPDFTSLASFRSVADGNDQLFVGYALDYAVYANKPYYGKKLADGTVWAKEITLPASAGVAGNGRYDVDIAPCNLSDGFYVKVLYSDANYYPQVMILKCSGNGAVLWSRIIDFPDGISLYSENNPIHVSSTDKVTFTLSTYDCMGVVTLNMSGAMMYAKRLAFSSAPEAKNPGFCFAPTSDGGFMGSMKDENNPSVFKLDSELHVQWCKEWSIEGYAHAKNVIRLANGKYAVCGYGIDEYTDANFLAILGVTGMVEKYYRMPTSTEDGAWIGAAMEMIELPDGKLLVSNEYSGHTLIDLNNETALFSTFINSSWSLASFSQASAVTVSMVGAENLTALVTEKFNPLVEGCLRENEISIPLIAKTVNPASVFTNTMLITPYAVTCTNYTVSTSNVGVTVTPGCRLADLEEETISGFTLAPNPVSGGNVVTITLDKVINGGKVLLTDLSGRKLYAEGLNGLTNSVALPSSVSSGMYVVSIVDENGEVLRSERLIVE